MNPLQVLSRQIAIIFVAFIIGLLVQWGILSIESANQLQPLINETIVLYLPIAMPFIASFIYQIYLQYIHERLFKVARETPASTTEQQILDKALGEGGKRTAAKLLTGVK